MRVYIDELLIEIKRKDIEGIVELTPTQQTEGHYRNVIVEYKNARKKPKLYPLSLEEYNEYVLNKNSK